MTSSPILDQRALQQRRDQALWRTRVAGMVAFVSAAISVIFFCYVGMFTDDWIGVAPYFLGAALTFGFGAGIYFAQSQLAAGALVLITFLSTVLRIVQTGRFGGIVLSGMIIYAYFQGLNGAMDLEELRVNHAMEID